VNEVAFPLLGMVLMFSIVLPASAALAKLLLLSAERLTRSRGVHALDGLRYLVLLASSGVPLAWFISASLHQAESGRSSSVCLAGHAAGAFCPEAAFFAGALVSCTALFALARRLGSPFARRQLLSARGEACAIRVAELLRMRPALAELRGRMQVHDELPIAIATLGGLRPRVLIASELVAALDDDALAAALHHELEHVRDRDPLRYFALWWALAVNPFGRWLLQDELARWLLCRELHCDRDAVLAGANAAALADAIVQAARSGERPALAALGNADVGAIALRVRVLLAYSEAPPERRTAQPVLRIALCALSLVALLPHGSSTRPLDVVHVAAESAASLVTGH
jgi:Zn-dependent protease with chaperone function